MQLFGPVTFLLASINPKEKDVVRDLADFVDSIYNYAIGLGVFLTLLIAIALYWYLQRGIAIRTDKERDGQHDQHL